MKVGASANQPEMHTRLVQQENRSEWVGIFIYRLCDQGEITDGFCLDAIVQVGSHTFKDLQMDESYKFKLLYKFTHSLMNGTTVVADNYFFCPKAMRVAKLKWSKKKRFVFTVPGKFEFEWIL